MITNIKYELYQAKVCDETKDILFMSYDWVSHKDANNNINVNNYDKVIIGYPKEANCVEEVLENLFKEFNSDSPRSFRSMSVSDVVVINYTYYNNIVREAYYCDSFGFTQIDLNEFLLDDSIQPLETKMTLEDFFITYLDSFGNGEIGLNCNHCPLCNTCTEYYMNTHGGRVPTSLEEIPCKDFLKSYFRLVQKCF